MPVKPHSPFEDIAALCAGAVLISLGLAILQGARLLTSGISGAAILLHYAFGWDLGANFFVLNLPFYWLAFRRLGKLFTLKTFACVALISLLMGNASSMFVLSNAHPAFASIAGGVVIGMGLLALFRHGASMGGVSALAVYLQKHHNWRAGHVMMGLDIIILVMAVFVMDFRSLAWSVVGAVVLNMMVGLNHKPGRYLTI